MDRDTEKPYRQNVGIIVFNRNGLVLAGDRIEYPGSFQLPQGGIDPGEAPAAAAVRELYEEVGLRMEAPAGEIAEWLTYDFPEDVPSRLKKYRGQRQKWFFFRWDGDPSTLNLSVHEREFNTVRWMKLEDVIAGIVSFKKSTYEQIGEEARRFIPLSLTVARLEQFSIKVGADGPVLSEDVNLEIRRGEILGLIGESGCGKTISALALTGMLPEPGGRVAKGRAIFNGQDVFTLSTRELRSLRGSRIGVIFQEPATALNPLLTIGRQLNEVFEFHPQRAAELGLKPEERIPALLRRVGFPEPDRIRQSYPHELSGGMLQRIVIVMALLLKPDLVVADEPTTALDVTVQAQIMQLLLELKDEEDCAILLITHNMGLVAQYADRLCVMYAGRIVERAPVDVFLSGPAHPYSQGLLAAIPDLEKEGNLQAIPGQVPSPKDYAEGCRFRDRCTKAFVACGNRPPMSSLRNEHETACWLYETPLKAVV